ncbi:MAG: MltA domain-containing protein [Alcaligenaceae bacterium]|nr:MltA domain-containing protein [Alcaligenaceae bacterium]
MNRHNFRTYLLIATSLITLYGCATNKDPLTDLLQDDDIGQLIASDDIRIDTAQNNTYHTSQFKNHRGRPLKGRYIKTHWSKLPGWSKQSVHQLVPVLRQNCAGLMRRFPKNTHVTSRANPAAWANFCQKLQQKQHIDNPIAFLESNLQPWYIPTRNKTTGYYIPVVSGDKKRHGPYQWPLFGTPYSRSKQHATRGYIETHPQQFNPLVWLNDPIEAFFLQIQGSGFVKLPNKRLILLAYNSHNGQPYRSLGRYLIRQGWIHPTKASMQGIKAWAKRQSPSKVRKAMSVNKRMPFFKIKHQSFVTGAYGIALTGQRSVAVDPRYIPLGTPIYMSSQGVHNIQRTLFAHDTGGAIKGAGRIDYFWGIGHAAGQKAGVTNQRNQVWILWPKEAGRPSTQ